MNRWAYG
jgi:hypothetical protein